MVSSSLHKEIHDFSVYSRKAQLLWTPASGLSYPSPLSHYFRFLSQFISLAVISVNLKLFIFNRHYSKSSPSNNVIFIISYSLTVSDADAFDSSFLLKDCHPELPLNAKHLKQADSVAWKQTWMHWLHFRDSYRNPRDVTKWCISYVPAKTRSSKKFFVKLWK